MNDRAQPPRSDLQEIARTLAVLFQAGDVVELRVPKTEREGTVSGYFNDHAALAKQLAARNGDAAVYVTMNPVIPALLARCANRVKSRVRTTTSDKDIARRLWILIDCDPVRPADISSTDAEHEAALELARRIRFVLAEEGWPPPVLADSGNGWHLLWLVDLPNDDASTELVKAVLKALSARFSDAAVKVDETVHNASRIIKCYYGTCACKGDNLSERPHRLSRILDAPSKLEPVPRELLEELAASAPKPAAARPAPARNTGARTGQFNLEAFLARHLSAREPEAHEGGRKWVLETCPFNAEHTAPDAAVFERADGSFGFKCFHNSCAGYGWRDVRALFEGPRPNRPAAPWPPPPEVEDEPPRGRPGRSPGGRPEPPKVIAYRELLEVQTEVGQMLFDGFPEPAKGATLKIGASRSGKTLLAVQEALSIASGKALFDYYRVLKPGPVMIVEQDDPAGAAGIKQIVERFKPKSDLPLYVVEKMPFGFGPALIDWLGNQIAKLSLRLIVLDSYTALRGSHGPGIDIVKVEQTELSQLDALGKEAGSAIEIIHHESKGAAGLDWASLGAGTFAMHMAVEGLIQVSRFRDLDGPERLVRIRARRHPADVYLVLRFRKDTLDHEWILESSAAELYPIMKQIQAEFDPKEPFGAKELSQATGVSRAHAYRQIDRLRFAGAIRKLGRGE